MIHAREVSRQMTWRSMCLITKNCMKGEILLPVNIMDMLIAKLTSKDMCQFIRGRSYFVRYAREDVRLRNSCRDTYLFIKEKDTLVVYARKCLQECCT
jgi:hypothetical protein